MKKSWFTESPMMGILKGSRGGDVVPEFRHRSKCRVRSLRRPFAGMGEAMRKSRFTEEQITFALRQSDAGTPVAEVCRQIGIAEATFYVWKKYTNLQVLELREVRQLKGANARLKRVVAELSLDRHILQNVLKKDLKPSRRREIALWIHERFQVSKKRSCRLALLRRST
jgi:putative transposase